MSAREDILASVRHALADRPAEPEAPTEYLATAGPADAGQLRDLFIDRVEDYQATVTRCRPAEVEATIAGLLGDKSVIVPPRLPWIVAGAAIDTGLGPSALDDIDAVVTAAVAGIAVTGTVVLDHAGDQGRRVLTLIPDTHICVVDSSTIVHNVPDALNVLDPARPTTWISGPSATSDIELERVEGVHGPRTLQIVLTDSRKS